MLTPKCKKCVKVKAFIRKAKSLIGATKHFFSNIDVDLRTKHNIYNSFTTNATLWGYKSWDLSMKNKNQLEAFHHSSIRRILNIKWQQVQSERIRNKQVRFHFCNKPKIEKYINRKTATYVGKIARSQDNELPKKFPRAWMENRRTSTLMQQQFARAISAIILNITQEKQGLLLRDWIPLDLEKTEWLNYLNTFFEACKMIDEEQEDDRNTNIHECNSTQAEENSNRENYDHLPHPPAHADVPCYNRAANVSYMYPKNPTSSLVCIGPYIQ
jgi:hypothetical protein